MKLSPVGRGRLRPYQVEDIAKVYAAWDRGVVRPTLVWATGLGKTDAIAEIATQRVLEARQRGERPGVLILVHRTFLLRQISKRLRLYLPDVSVGVVKGQQNEAHREVVIAMVSTLRNPNRQRQMLRPRLVIVDECHHAPAMSYMSTMRWAGCFDEDHPTRALGVTATLVRGDKLGLADVWQTVAAERSIVWAVGNGYLVPPRGRCVIAPHMQLNKVKVRAGDYGDGELGEMIEQDVAAIVDGWLREAIDDRYPEGRPTCAFTPNVASARALCDEFNQRGVKAELVIGSTPDHEREAIERRLGEGTTRVKVDVMVGTEGFDCPPVACILLARPTKLLGLFTQIVGRGLRTLDPQLFPGWPTKHDCLVLDVVGVSRHQKLVTVVDLVPTAERVTEDLDEALALVPCEVCGQLPDECVCGQEEGPARRAKAKLSGRVEYEDVSLFQQSSLHWMRTYAGVRFAAVGDKFVHLWDEGNGLWSAATVNVSGDHANGMWLVERVPPQRAVFEAEEWAKQHTGRLRGDIRREHAGRPGARLLEYARLFGIGGREEMNATRLSDEINIRMASARLDNW